MNDLRAEDLKVVFQPIVRLTDGTIFAREALVRCQWPEFRYPPKLFETAVEEAACGRLGRTIREVTFASPITCPVFLNLHPHELSSRWLVRPDDPLGFHDQPVFLEITESAAFDYFELCTGVLKEVCSRTGASLVVDDFGAGHSNLMRIVELEPAVVKLDIALVRGLDKNPRQQKLVAGVVRLCRELSAAVVAEGIESVEELRAVIDTGVDFGQGYLLARPGEPEAEVQWPL